MSIRDEDANIHDVDSKANPAVGNVNNNGPDMLDEPDSRRS
jgi:hypothetical protein